jgi:hypothetical protein
VRMQPCGGIIWQAHRADDRPLGIRVGRLDPQCLEKSGPRRDGIYALTENVASPFHTEPGSC